MNDLDKNKILEKSKELLEENQDTNLHKKGSFDLEKDKKYTEMVGENFDHTKEIKEKQLGYNRETYYKKPGILKFVAVIILIAILIGLLVPLFPAPIIS